MPIPARKVSVTRTALYLAGEAPEAGIEDFESEVGVKGVGAHALKVGDYRLLTGPDAVDLSHDSHIVVAEVHSITELQREAGLGVGFRSGLDVLEAAREHGVYGQRVSRLRLEKQELAPTADAGQSLPRKPLSKVVGGREPDDDGDAGHHRVDPDAGNLAVEECDYVFEVGYLGHGGSSWGHYTQPPRLIRHPVLTPVRPQYVEGPSAFRVVASHPTLSNPRIGHLYSSRILLYYMPFEVEMR